MELENTRGLLARRHLRTRCQQRGLKQEALYILAGLADREVSVGGGRVSMTLTHRAASELLAEGTDPGLVDQARRRAVVIDEQGLPVTVLVMMGRRGRPYRRGRVRRRMD